MVCRRVIITGCVGPATLISAGPLSRMLPVPAIVYCSGLENEIEPNVTPLFSVIVDGALMEPRVPAPPPPGTSGWLSQFAASVHVPLPGLIHEPLTWA